MGLKNELLNIIPQEYVSDRSKYRLHTVATEYNCYGKICEESALELISAIAEIFTRVHWAYASMPEYIETFADKVRKDTEQAAKDMISGEATINQFSDIKDNVAKLFKLIGDIEDRKITG